MLHDQSFRRYFGTDGKPSNQHPDMGRQFHGSQDVVLAEQILKKVLGTWISCPLAITGTDGIQEFIGIGGRKKHEHSPSPRTPLVEPYDACLFQGIISGHPLILALSHNQPQVTFVFRGVYLPALSVLFLLNR